MRLFRAIGLVLFLFMAKTILLAIPYQDFETTLSAFFQTTTTGLRQTEQLLLNIDTGDSFEINNIASVPAIDFSYRP